MRYIARFHDAQELARVRGLWRSKGIPTHQAQVEHRRIGEQWGLYVCIPEQVEDALRLIRDPDHEPALSVDAAAFEQALQGQDQALLVRLATLTALVVVPVAIAVILIIGLLG
jgi:hypothetical protein